MNSRADARIRAFVVELLNDPPESPPFPDADMIVIKVDQWDLRKRMANPSITHHRTGHPGRRRGPIVAISAFVSVLLIFAGSIMVTSLLNRSAPDVSARGGADAVNGAATLIGTTGRIIDVLAAGSLPETIEFGADGTYRVIDDGDVMDTGTYVTEGDLISFESAPTKAVVWVKNHPNAYIHRACEGLVGEYRVTFQDTMLYTLDVVWDECMTRVAVANGLEIQLLTD